MAISALPWWPLILFGIIEPAACTWGYILTLTDPFRFFADQAPNYPITRASFTGPAVTLTLQLGNVILLLAAIALICCWTTNVRTIRWYLIAVALGDLGHIYATAQGVGSEYFWDVSRWNDMIWGNVGFSAFLHVNRLLTVLGVFGSLR